jgi:hypothetical protein
MEQINLELEKHKSTIDLLEKLRQNDSELDNVMMVSLEIDRRKSVIKKLEEKLEKEKINNTLAKYCKIKQTKPVDAKTIEYRRQYYQANKQKILEAARNHSKAKYQDPEHKEAVRVKNAEYREVMKAAKKIFLENAFAITEGAHGKE